MGGCCRGIKKGILFSRKRVITNLRGKIVVSYDTDKFMFGIYNRQAANVTAQHHVGYFAPGRFRSVVITELVCRACTSISRFLCLFGS